MMPVSSSSSPSKRVVQPVRLSQYCHLCRTPIPDGAGYFCDHCAAVGMEFGFERERSAGQQTYGDIRCKWCFKSISSGDYCIECSGLAYMPSNILRCRWCQVEISEGEYCIRCSAPFLRRASSTGSQELAKTYGRSKVPSSCEEPLMVKSEPQSH